MDKLLIIDGSNLLFQMFFGMPARIFNKKGKGIWATLGFIGAALKLIKKFSPTHIVVLFDGETKNERKDLSFGRNAAVSARDRQIPKPLRHENIHSSF